jgi:hypothetical protein
MMPDEALRALRIVRFQPLRGRKITMAWLSRMTGYRPGSLFRAASRGWLAPAMAQRIGTVLSQTVSLPGGHIAPKSGLGDLAGGPDPRGGPRPVRRVDDRRLRSARRVHS